MTLKYVKVANSSDIADKNGLHINVGGVDIALFRNKEKLFAFKDSCPHQGAPLSDGYVQDGSLVCLYHSWKFSLEDGTFINNNTLKLRSYPLKEKDGEVFIRLK